MKPVLPKLKEFGEDLDDQVDRPAVSSQRTKRARPFYPPKSTLRSNRPEAAANFSDRVVPSAINAVDGANSKEAPAFQSNDEDIEARKLQAKLALKELKQLQAMWESQSKAQSQVEKLGQFTLVGKGAPILMNSNRLTVLNVNEVEEDLRGLNMDLSGAAEWTAVSLQLPKEHTQGQLACILLCKGVLKSQLPRVNMSKLKPGSIGVPTFHCVRCMRRWLRRGQIPESCSECEDLTEGPPMCITHQPDEENGVTEMIVGGALGSDGKPVRIKVELPVDVEKMFKKEQKKKRKKKEAGNERVGITNVLSVTGKASFADIHGDKQDEDSGGSDEDDELFDLPDSFRRYILKKAAKQDTFSKSMSGLSRSSKEFGASMKSIYKSNSFNAWSMSDFTTSSLSSLASKVDSAELLKYFESGESTGEDFLSDEYSLNSQLDMSGGENASKPNKKNKASKSGVENVSATSSYDSMAMLHDSDNELNMAAMSRSQSRVISHEDILKKRSKSYPDPESRQKSRTPRLPPLKGAPSSQSVRKYSSRRQPPGRLTNNTRLPNGLSDEAGVLKGRSFDGMVPKTGSTSVVAEEVAESAIQTTKDRSTRGHRADGISNRDRPPNKGDCESDLHLPKISDGFLATAATEKSNKQSANHVQGGEQSPHNQTSQSLRLPQLNADKGVISQQQQSYMTQPDVSSANVNTRQMAQDGMSGQVPESASQAYRDGHTTDMEVGGGGGDKSSDSHAMFKLDDNNTSSPSTLPRGGGASNAAGNRRGSIPNPSFPAAKGSQKGRPSRVSQATVKEDVEIPTSHSNRTRGRPPQRPRAKRTEDMPLLQKFSENNLNKTLSSQLPEMPVLSRRQSMEMKSFHLEDNIPRRIGQKLVKKKKGEDHTRESVMHNSKDIGNVIEGSEVDNSKSATVQSSSSRRPSAFLSIEEDSNTISNSQSPLSNFLRASQDAGANFGYNSLGNNMADATNMLKSRPASGGMGSKLSSGYAPPPGSNLLQENGGSSIPPVLPPVLPPVRLKPLDPTQATNSDIASSTGPQVLSSLVSRELTGETELGSLESTADQQLTDGGEKMETGNHEEGLEAIMEESEPESDDDEDYYDIHPIPDLKPVSTLSFSSNAFSYFPMGGAHRRAYQSVHQKAVGSAMPKIRSHRTPVKRAKRRKR